MGLTEQQKQERIRDLRPIDDVFFEVLARNVSVCQEMLRTILEDDSLVVTSVITQSDKRNLYGRSVRLDALCTLGNGTKVNVEVQRSDNDNHLKRARFNASSITVRESETGTKFEEVLELYIVYISEFCFLTITAPNANTAITMGSANTMPLKVRSDDVAKSVNTWQNVLVTEANTTELPTQTRVRKSLGDVHFMHTLAAARIGQPMRNSLVRGLAPESSAIKLRI